MASSSDADVGLRLRLFGRREVRDDLRDTQRDLENTADEVKGLGDRAIGAAKGLAELIDSKFTKGLRNLSDGAKTAGVGIAKGLAVGVAAAGAAVGAALTAAVLKGVEAQGASRQLQASLGLTPEEAADAGRIAGRIYAQNYGESRADVASALATLSTSTGLPVTDQQIQDATRSALNLAAAFEVDVAGSARAAGQLVRTNLVDTLSEAYALITAGFQAGADRGEDFLDTLNEYATTFAALGLTGEEAVGSIAQAMDAGILNSDFAADALRETGIRVREMSDDTASAIQSLGLDAEAIGTAFDAGGSEARNALDTLYDALRNTEDAGLRNSAAAAIVGSQYEDLGDAILAIDPSTAAAGLGNVADAASNLDAALSSGITPSLDAVKRGLEGIVTGAGAALVERWGPDVEAVLDRVSGGIATLSEDLPGLGEDLAAFVSTGDLTGLGARLESAFGLPAGSIADLSAKTEAFVSTLRDDVLPVVGAVLTGFTEWAAHKIGVAVPILTAVVGFLADHTEGLTRIVYLGLIAWGAYRGIMLAVAAAKGIAAARLAVLNAQQRIANSLGWTWLRIKGMELAAWARSTAATVASTVAGLANRAVYGAGWLLTFVGVKGLELAAWVRSTAATVASTAAQLAAAAAGAVVRGATIAATAAQWLFNAAMSANPIGLVIAAIALLVGGLVWFFTKTELGQKAWDALSKGFRTAVDWITGTAVPAIKVGFAAAIDFAREKFDAIRDGVAGFIDKVKEALEWVAKLADKLTGGALTKVAGWLGFGGDEPPEGRATGGTVRANVPYIVGEEGAELFVPGVTGTILPSEALAQVASSPGVPQVRSARVPTGDLDDDAGIPDGMATLTLEVPLIVDGREIARATLAGLHTNAAWT